MEDIIDCALGLLHEQYCDLTDNHELWEMSYLRDEAQKGIDKLGLACHIVFGTNLELALFQALKNAEELNAHAYSLLDILCDKDDEEKLDAIEMAFELAGAARAIHEIQCNQSCSRLEQSYKLSCSTDYYAQMICAILDPDDTLCQQL